MTLSKWVRNQADSIPDKTAIIFENKKISYADLAILIDNYAHILVEELSLKRGDRVAYLGYNSPEFIVLLFACARTGTIIIPLNWRLAEPEHIQLLNLSKPKALFVENDFTDHFNDIQQQIDSLTLINFGSEKHNWNAFSELAEKYKGQYLVSEVSQTTEDDAVLICFTSGTNRPGYGTDIIANVPCWRSEYPDTSSIEYWCYSGVIKQV
ncbi:MAG: AMP-binding protein [Gammaproteobacteria bacterium]|nr:AMP-binding protein [Gammaproteobacteria bacterium]